jgi:hypothetical protein
VKRTRVETTEVMGSASALADWVMRTSGSKTSFYYH